LNKFAKYYEVTKLKSIFQLVSFLYDLNCNLNLIVNIRNGFMIHIQVESIKRYKTEESEHKWKLSAIIKDKENLDPQVIPNWKIRKASKKKYNLNKNVLKNQPNWSKIIFIIFLWLYLIFSQWHYIYNSIYTL